MLSLVSLVGDLLNGGKLLENLSSMADLILEAIVAERRECRVSEADLMEGL